MATRTELVSLIDTFLAARKRIAGAVSGYHWGPGYSPYEKKAKFPLEVNGEMNEYARFEVVGFPDEQALKFRLILCFHVAVCRLDYTDEIHPNSHRIDSDGVPPIVEGPHYHSWAINRRFFRGGATATQLHNAAPFTNHPNFDSILRWFCTEVNIDQPPGGHLIALPPRERLL